MNEQDEPDIAQEDQRRTLPSHSPPLTRAGAAILAPTDSASTNKHETRGQEAERARVSNSVKLPSPRSSPRPSPSPPPAPRSARCPSKRTLPSFEDSSQVTGRGRS